MEKLIELQELSVHFTHEDMQKTCALNKVNISINTHEHIAILGENGSGKSTLLRVLRGEIYPDQVDGGKITWYENGLPETSPLAGRNITALISPKVQEYYETQAWNVTCLEIILAAKSNDFILYRKPNYNEIQEVISLAKSLDASHLLDRRISELSQGQLRLILIIRAFIRKARVLLLDEATNGLDNASRILVITALEILSGHKDCPSIVLTSHRSPLPDFITKSYQLEQGEISPYFLPPKQFTSATKIARKFPTTSVHGLHISLNNADVFLDHKKILKSVNFELKPYQQWAIKGNNGSGKSTLLKTILGFLPVALGGVINRTFYSEEHQNGLPLQELALIKQHIRLVSDELQTHYTYNDTVEDIVFAGLDGNIGVYREASEEDIKMVNSCINTVKMGHLRHRPLRSLSTGQARKAILARALVGKPGLLLLDEPFSGLDEKNRLEFIELLETLIYDGLQTILVSHHETDILPSTTHFALMRDGQLFEDA